MKIHSIYTSISGEVSSIPQGSFVTILRLSGCSLDCNYCDAQEAKIGIGDEISEDRVYEMINSHNNRNILITGGEPLLQLDELNQLMLHLLPKGYNVVIETNGTINPWNCTFFDNVSFVVDYKMPFSNSFFEMKLENFLELREFDYVKFVCSNKQDVDIAIETSRILLDNGCIAKMAIGQTWRWLQKKDFDLVKFLIQENQKDFIINCQLHRFLNCE